MTGLTRSQKKAFDFIAGHIDEYGIAPTLEEVSQALGRVSRSSSHRTVAALIERGYLRRVAPGARALEIVRRIGDPPLPRSDPRLHAYEETLRVIARGAAFPAAEAQAALARFGVAA